MWGGPKHLSVKMSTQVALAFLHTKASSVRLLPLWEGVRGRRKGRGGGRGWEGSAPVVQEPPASEPTHVHAPLHQCRPQLPEGQEVVGHSLQEGARCPPQKT